jgi:hypothetical protein
VVWCRRAMGVVRAKRAGTAGQVSWLMMVGTGVARHASGGAGR